MNFYCFSNHVRTNVVIEKQNKSHPIRSDVCAHVVIEKQ